MKLLLDANISAKMVSKLKANFRDCIHADEIGLAMPVKDVDLWRYAVVHNCLLVTNDKDFLNLTSENSLYPKVLLLRTVNQGTGYLCGLIVKHAENLSLLFNSREYSFLDII